MKFTFDVHLDIAWNATAFDRDQLLSIADMRDHEKHRPGKPRGKCTVSLPEMRRANIGLCLATVLARSRPESNPTAEPPRTDIDYVNQEAAYAMAQGQLAWYRLMERQGHLRQIKTRADLDDIYKQWQQGKDDAPIGYILSMEGADPIFDINEVDGWYADGLRTVCLAHYGPSAYAMGTGGDGPLTDRGRELCKKLDEVGIILDLVHTADQSFDEALDLYTRPVFVSHCNARALVPGDRQLSDAQIKAVAQRGGVIGIVGDAWMVTPDWQRGKTTNENTTMAHLADHIDHIAQTAGGIDHVGIGSDLDGGYGTEQCPNDLDTIADLHKLEDLMAKRNYSDEDIEKVFSANFIRFFRESLPQ